ncbi:MAG: TlpA family protein disulfide reductase [Deltaproteobacteria bacterium]|nr:TlpA family protein disulfide reductase [Deltaproteobacteria bacterium]
MRIRTHARQLGVVIAAVALLLASGTVTNAGDPSRVTLVKGGYFDIKGMRQSFGALAGRPTLVVFWASWCGPCVDEIPSLNTLHERFGARGLRVLGLSVDFISPAETERLAKKYSMRYDVGAAEPELVIEFGFQAIPTSYLFDGHGAFVKRYTGAPPLAVLQADIEKLITPGSTT